MQTVSNSIESRSRRNLIIQSFLSLLIQIKMQRRAKTL